MIDFCSHKMEQSVILNKKIPVILLPLRLNMTMTRSKSHANFISAEIATALTISTRNISS